MKSSSIFYLIALLSRISWALEVTEIQGVSFQSPMAGRHITNVTGVVTAKDKYGIWIQGDPSDDLRASNGLRVYGAAAVRFANVNDLVSIDGRVAEYRKNSNDLYLTEIDYITSLTVLSKGHAIKPLILGVDRTPPHNQLSSLDVGRDGWLSVPNNVTLLELTNPPLQPEKFGLDFWESLEGQLVTIKSPTATNFPDRFGSFWVYGDWPVAGRNDRGGLTIHLNDGKPPAHPEAILIGRALDSTHNPKTTMGTVLDDITGIVTYQFGTYSVLPLTAPVVNRSPVYTVPPATFNSTHHPCQIRIGDYNVENMSPRSHHISKIAAHVADHLHAPDILFVQEIQDDSGSRNDGVVSANETLHALADAIRNATGGIVYDFVNIEPENNKDGGKPGGNIRVAYLWRPEKVSLIPGTAGNATIGTFPVVNIFGDVQLSWNPGRIDPSHPAWEETRKPLAAGWQTTNGDRFFTVNVHFSSKRGSSSAQGDARPPVNGEAEKRSSQANVTASFVASILAVDPSASVIVAGDMNEYTATRAVLRPLAGLLHDANDVGRVPPFERYTYAYDQNAQEIDHVFVSDAIAKRGGDVEHVHVNTWAETIGDRASDHDPTVVRVWVCDVDADATDVIVEEVGEGHGQTTLQI